jgi:hypothetical protein
MSEDKDKTKVTPPEFDFSGFPENTVFHERRSVVERRDRDVVKRSPSERASSPHPDRRVRQNRRRRVDPTTFEKQYTVAELEFMNAMQRFKEHSGKPFPSYGEVIKVAVSLGYRQVVEDD